MHMVRRLSALALTLALLLGSPFAAPAAAQQPPLVNLLNIPLVNVPVTDLVGGAAGVVFNGTAAITRFARVPGQPGQAPYLAAVGMLTGTVQNAAGQVLQTVVQNFSLPITAAAVPCQILNLSIAPINIDLLGLVINIPNTIVINITAVPGAGNLLGNLLCGVTGLLDGGAGLGQIVLALNNLLGNILGSL
jgi:hypothetical protein